MSLRTYKSIQVGSYSHTTAGKLSKSYFKQPKLRALIISSCNPIEIVKRIIQVSPLRWELHANEGKIEGKIKIAKNMIKKGTDNETIAEVIS